MTRNALFPRLFLASCLALLCFNVILGSWVEEDAFISFRFVDNVLHGYGLRWNINERVQGFTNPLWTLLHIPVLALTHQIVVATSLISWACFFGTLWVTWRSFERDPLRYGALFILMMYFALTDWLYFTSGLETPLTSMLFACFGYVVVRRPKRFWFWLSFVTACAAWARLDMVLLYAPAWFYLLWTQRRSIAWGQIFIGAIPLIGWFAFALFYYGFFLPNTAYAKLSADIPLMEYIESGLAYTYDFILADPLSAALIMYAVIALPFKALRTRAPDAMLAAMLALGVAVYCAYVIRIGGYQLSMRMYATPAFAACWLFYWRFPAAPPRMLLLTAALAAMLHSTGVKVENRISMPFISNHSVRGWAVDRQLFRKHGPMFWQYHLARKDLSYRVDRRPFPRKVQVQAMIGMIGFDAGPSRVIIDPLALTDPLLSRLPPRRPHLRKPGHIGRTIPAGYVDAMKSGKLDTMSPALAAYYAPLQLITRGELWDVERLKTIVRFNLGEYDHYRDEYVANTAVCRNEGLPLKP